MEIHEDTLETRLDAAEEKSEQIERAQNTRQRLSTTTDRIDELRGKLNNIETAAEELSFYVGVLEEVFGGSRSNCYGLTEEVEDARRKANISDEELLGAAEELSFAEYISELNDASNHIDKAIEMVKEHTRSTYVGDYRSDLAQAKELNSIISGGNDQFTRHIEKMQSFINRHIWNTDRSVSTLASRWDKMRAQWRRHSDKQSWEHFQEQHGLSETTIVELRQFTEQDVVKLSDLSVKTLEEAKQVDELESALEVTLQT